MLLVPLIFVLSVSLPPYATVLPRNLTLFNNGSQGVDLFSVDEYSATARCFDYDAASFNYHLCFVNTTADAFTFSIMTRDSLFFDNRRQSKVVWSANRNRLVKEDAMVQLREDGNLCLWDAEGTSLVWSTNTSNQGVTGIYLDDWGMLALYNSSNDTLWDSYHHPTDVLVQYQGLEPGMQIVSRVSDEDGSEGPYRLVMETGGLALYYTSPLSMMNSTQPYWLFSCYGKNDTFSVQHTCNDRFTFLLDGAATLDFVNFTANNIPDDSKAPQLCRFNSSACSKFLMGFDSPGFELNISFLKLESNGFLRGYSYDTQQWLLRFDLFQNDACFLPETCGAYGICSKSGASCICPAAGNSNDDTFQQKLNTTNGFSGCSPPRNLSSTCPGLQVAANASHNLHQHFLNLSAIDYFPNMYATPQNFTDLDDCLKVCLDNCSCLAVFYHRDTVSCFHQAGNELGTLRSVSNASFLAFLKVEDGLSAMVTDHTSKAGLIAGLVVGISVSITLGLVLLLLFVFKRSVNEEERDDSDDEKWFLDNLSTALPTRYTVKEMQRITQNFKKVLGEGGFGKVYEGVLSNGNRVAVKKLESKNQGKKEFRAEVATIGGIHHVNLVRLCGFCSQGATRLLVYEYMSNGSLEKWLFTRDHHADQHELSWRLRCEIAVGTARGLAYLHEECHQRIIHLDVKPQNILLDGNFVAKLSDFGLSRLVSRGESSYIEMTRARGTLGYIAPECLQHGGISRKADAYSFGILLLEIVSGRKNQYPARALAAINRSAPAAGAEEEDEEEHCLVAWVIRKAEQDNLEVVLLGRDHGGATEQAGRQFILIALLCLQEDPEKRPSMVQVVQMLEGQMDVDHLDVRELVQGIALALRPRQHLKAPEGQVQSCSGAHISSLSLELDGR